MWSSDDSEPELVGAAASSDYSSSSSVTPPQSPPPPASPRSQHRRRHRRRRKKTGAAPTPPQVDEDTATEADEEEPASGPEAEDVWRGAQWEAAWPGRHHPKPPVVVAVAEDADGAVGRSRSLTDDDLEELKGCADLGFGFSYDEIPELRGTLPALELCYSMSQHLLLDDHHAAPAQAHQAADASSSAPEASSAAPVTNWKISSPGDSPDEVKARLKYWAQAVACTVRLCS